MSSPLRAIPPRVGLTSCSRNIEEGIERETDWDERCVVRRMDLDDPDRDGCSRVSEPRSHYQREDLSLPRVSTAEGGVSCHDRFSRFLELCFRFVGR